MKTNEYIQTVRASILYATQIKDIENILIHFDSIRKLHTGLQNKLECLLLDPHSYELPETREEIQRTAIEIRETCIAANVISKFFKLPPDYITFSKQHFESRSFARYYYAEVDITDLIVYKKKEIIIKKKKTVLEELGEAKFEGEISNDPEFIRLNNQIPGL